ncbi:MAG: hypothetical protein ACI87O_001418 [Planctomycetota bacterium]|jgi:hypothetical protein
MRQKIKNNTLSLTALLGCVSLLCGASIAGTGIGTDAPISDAELSSTSSVLALTTPLLGDAESFAVMGGSTVTVAAIGTVITGNVGTSPGTSITGIPAGGTVVPPYATHSNDAAAIAARVSTDALFTDLATMGGATLIPAELGGTTIGPGTYYFSSSANIAAGTTLTLDGAGLYIFKVGSAITANVLSNVVLSNGASACDVFWQVTSAATLNGVTFSGTVVAYAAITIGVNAVLDGRALTTTAGAVTMAGNATVNLPCGENIGSSYCSSPTNSTGQQGQLSATGSILALDTDVTLTVTQVPDGQVGFVLASQTQGLLVNPGGSEGNLCLGGDLARFNRPGEIGIVTGGSFNLVLPFGDFPEHPNFGVTVMAGDTWNFQFWHRDAMGGSSTSNFTNGLEILFE